MGRLLTLLPIALLAPAYAQADAFNDDVATVVHYSKWALVILGAYLLYKSADPLNTEDKKQIRLLKAAGFISIIPGTLLFFLNFLGFLNGPSAPSASSSGVEYMLAQAGLIDCAKLGRLDVIHSLVGAILFYSVAVSGWTGTFKFDNDVLKGIGNYLVSSGIIIAIFNPIGLIQVQSSNSAQAILSAHQAAAISGKILGPSSNSSALLPAIEKNTKTLVGNSYGTAHVPLVLSKINAGMDDFVGEVTEAIADKGFDSFRTAGAQSMANNITAHLPGALTPDLRQRLGWYIDKCAMQIINEKEATDPTFASNPRRAANSLNLVSPSWVTFFQTRNSPACVMMLRGGYNESGGTFTTPGSQFPLGLQDEILSNIEYRDPRVRALYPGIKSLKDMPAYLDQIKGLFASPADWQALVNHSFTNSVEIPYQQWSAGAAANLQASLAMQGTTLTGGLLKLAEGLGMGVAKTVTGAGSSQFVNMEMPIWMGGLQMFLLALFPLVFALSLLPGRASLIGWHLAVLFWSKSYIIGWALISTIDRWFSTAVDYSVTSGVSAGSKLAMIHAIQQMQMWTPWLMAVIIFGPKVVGAHGAAKGAGAA